MNMDLIVEPQRGRPFMVEVWYFDTVLQIKQKIQKCKGIPVSMQTLILHDHTLPDDADIEKLYLLDNSHVQLHIAADFFIDNLPVKTEKPSPTQSTVKLPVHVKTPSSKIRTLEMEANDTVSKLKERSEEIEACSKLHDHHMLPDCEICEYSVTNVKTEESAPARSPSQVPVKCRTPLGDSSYHDNSYSCQDACSWKKTSNGRGFVIRKVMRFVIKSLWMLCTLDLNIEISVSPK